MEANGLHEIIQDGKRITRICKDMFNKFHKLYKMFCRPEWRLQKAVFCQQSSYHYVCLVLVVSVASIARIVSIVNIICCDNDYMYSCFIFYYSH